KTFCEKKLAELRERSLKLSERVEPKHSLSENEKSIFYANPLYSAVHLYTSTGTEGRSLDEISKRFGISRAKTVSASTSLFVRRSRCC
ncbi:MAG: hypothetical protein ACXWRE_13850, partial [Pseudobdellovibrionaceae bacterium]